MHSAKMSGLQIPTNAFPADTPALLCRLLLLYPRIDLLLQQHQGQAAGTKYLGMELPDGKLVTQRLLGFGAQFPDF